MRPKNGRDRSVPLNDRALEALRNLPHLGRWVVQQQHANGSRQVTERKALKALQKVLKQAGIQEGKLHTFRHFFISYCANQGVPPPMVMKWVGQRDLAVIMEYYHLTNEESHRAMSSLSFGASASPKGADSNKHKNKDSGHGKEI
jgi:integrase